MDRLGRDFFGFLGDFLGWDRGKWGVDYGEG